MVESGRTFIQRAAKIASRLRKALKRIAWEDFEFLSTPQNLFFFLYRERNPVAELNLWASGLLTGAASVMSSIGRVRDALVWPRKRQLFPMLPGSAEPAQAPVAKWPWTEDRGVVVDVSAMQVLLEKGLGQKRHPLLIWSQGVISGTGLPRVDVVLHDNLVVLMEVAAECSQREIFEDLAR